MFLIVFINLVSSGSLINALGYKFINRSTLIRRPLVYLITILVVFSLLLIGLMLYSLIVSLSSNYLITLIFLVFRTGDDDTSGELERSVSAAEAEYSASAAAAVSSAAY